MQKVNSFIVDHTRLKPGIYESEINGAYTYDIRFVAPQDAAQKGVFMKPQVAHTLEHFLADYLRTKCGQFAEKLLYVGPMGCLTGFYILTTEPFAPEFLRDLILMAVEHILQAQEGEIPGASELTCGNWQYFDLSGTKEFIKDRIVPNFSSDEFSTEYPYVSGE